MRKILVVDDDPTLRLTVRAPLERKGYQVTQAGDGQEAIQKCLDEGPFDVAIIDVNMPNMNGIDALSHIKEISPKTFCIMLTAYSKVEDAVTTIKHGAYDYLEKPVDTERILSLIEAAKQASTMVQVAANSAPELQFDEGRSMIGSSRSIKKVFDLIYKLAKVETSVLIRGESGTGKELVAQALHFNSHRKKGPFVAVNCGALPDNLIESELFGHEKGAFTGADRRKIGKFQYAAGGTIFLDEVGDISAQMQVKLLRVLQEKKFTPVGSNQEISADVRVISATNRHLEDMIKKNEFREDLFYRLNVLPINLPPLRDRRDDILSLCSFMIDKFNRIHDRQISEILPDSLEALKAYSWPGNIRELENVIEHAFIIESDNKIHLSSLPSNIQACAPVTFVPTGELSEDAADHNPNVQASNGIVTDFSELKYPVLKERFEREFIIRALRAFNGRINQTAEHTQMTKVTLLRKLEKYKINPKEFR